MRISPFVILLSLTSLSLLSCSSTKHKAVKRLPGMWQVSPITIDGSNKDWPSPYPEYDDKAQLGYAVTNDKDNLYITVETGDPATQLKILKGGLTVWIDKTGGQDEITAINYPIPGSSAKTAEDRPQSMHMSGGQSGGGDVQKRMLILNDKVKAALGDAREFSLEGFKACNAQFTMLQKDSCGIVIKMALDEDNELVWEAVVPFKTFFYKAEIEKRDQGKPISVCFETTGLPRPAGGGGGHSGGGNGGGFRPSIGMGGMGMGMGGGRSHGGGNHNNNAQPQDNTMEPMYKSTKTWKHFGVAFHE